MEESYGFDTKEDTGSSIIYMLSFAPKGGKTRYLTIRENATDGFSNAFRELIQYSGSFLNNKLEEEAGSKKQAQLLH